MNSRRVFLGVMTIVFVASAAMTIVWCRSMSAMGRMAMPGGWTMSHMWMVMPGQTLLGATASFVGMWVVMMVAMMLPSSTPALLRCRESMGHGGTAIVGAGYFSAWAALGGMVFPLGSALANLAMRQSAVARAVPIGVAAVVIIAGVVQCTAWKARQLALCRDAAGPGRTLSGGGGAAWRHGWCLGTHCVQSCAGLTTVMLALGVMDLRVMAAVTVAITVERLAPNGVRTAGAVGGIVVATGATMLALAAA